MDNYKKQYIQQVYTHALLLLSILTITCCVFYKLQVNYGLSFTVSIIGLIFSIIQTFATKYPRKYSCATAVFLGMSLHPVIDLCIQAELINEIVLAVLGTITVFACMTLVSLVCDSEIFLYLGGPLASGLSILCWLGLANIFLGFEILDLINIYGGLVLFSLYISYDTHIILSRNNLELNERNCVFDALNLFLDFINIFIRILSILIKNKENSLKKKK
jgi:FtsH-binding integral membrane protein